MIFGVLLGLGIAALAGAARWALAPSARSRAADEQVALVAAAVGGVSSELAAELAAEREQMRNATIEAVIAVAGETLGGHTRQASHELDLRSRSFDEKVATMSRELRQVTDLVASLQKEKAEQHGQLQQGLSETLRASAALTDTTQRLHEALANSRARGQWGERMAEDVLRTAGFVEGLNYSKQTTLAGGGRPDFTFLLPRDRVLHMDVKFPLDNYLRLLDAEREDDKAAFTKSFLRDVRARLKELSNRDYLDPDTTVGYVLLFIPNEAVYGFVHEADPHLLDDALARQVVLCSPCTLFAVLGVVRQAVDSFLLSRTSDEILQCLTGFTKQWVAFSEKLDRLGAQVDTVQRTYDDLAGTRRRQLQKQLDQVEVLRRAKHLDELGASPGVIDAGLSADDGRDPPTGLAVVERAS